MIDVAGSKKVSQSQNDIGLAQLGTIDVELRGHAETFDPKPN